MFSQESMFGSSDVYGADDFPRFSACSRDDRALCTSWRVDSLVFWLCEGLKAFRVCLAFLGCFFFRANKAEFSHFLVLHFHVI